MGSRAGAAKRPQRDARRALDGRADNAARGRSQQVGLVRRPEYDVFGLLQPAVRYECLCAVGERLDRRQRCRRR